MTGLKKNHGKSLGRRNVAKLTRSIEIANSWRGGGGMVTSTRDGLSSNILCKQHFTLLCCALLLGKQRNQTRQSTKTRIPVVLHSACCYYGGTDGVGLHSLIPWLIEQLNTAAMYWQKKALNREQRTSWHMASQKTPTARFCRITSAKFITIRFPHTGSRTARKRG